MVETRNISLGGLLFHVELPAYTQLKDYLSDLRQVLRGTEGKEEVLQEVEYRFAELFTTFMEGSHRAVVTLKDVEKACAQLGAPSEFRGPEEQDGPSAKKSAQGPKKRRLFRDPDNRVISGLSAGIAHRIGIEPIVIRALFIVLGIGRIGIILYLILWIFLPKAKSASDRVAMKGDPVTLDAIKETVEDQLLKAKAEFDNPKSMQRFRAGWSRFISNQLPQFLKGLVRTLGWFAVALAVVLFLALGGLLISAIVTGVWNFRFVF